MLRLLIPDISPVFIMHELHLYFLYAIASLQQALHYCSIYQYERLHLHTMHRYMFNYTIPETVSRALEQIAHTNQTNQTLGVNRVWIAKRE